MVLNEESHCDFTVPKIILSIRKLISRGRHQVSGSSGKSERQSSCSLRIILCVNTAETSGAKIFIKLTSDEKLGLTAQEAVGKYSRKVRHCCSVPRIQKTEHSNTSTFRHLSHNVYCTYHTRNSLNTASTLNLCVLYDY